MSLSESSVSPAVVVHLVEDDESSRLASERLLRMAGYPTVSSDAALNSGATAGAAERNAVRQQFVGTASARRHLALGNLIGIVRQQSNAYALNTR
jgi:hypothetical protein